MARILILARRLFDRIFALPLSFLFLVLLMFAGMLWYMILVEKFHAVVGMASIVSVTMLFLLMWTSTVGDAYWYARATLLRPDISIGLLKAIGRDEQVVFARALERTQLGLDIVNVTVTTNKVLYVVFSLLIFAAYIIPK